MCSGMLSLMPVQTNAVTIPANPIILESTLKAQTFAKAAEHRHVISSDVLYPELMWIFPKL